MTIMTEVPTSLPSIAVGPAPGRKPKGRRIVLFGDSHSHAVQRAIDKRIGKGLPVPIVAYRLLKEKGEKPAGTSLLSRFLPRVRRRRATTTQLGDITLEEFLKIARKLGPDDVVLSMIGGNQHAVFSTIQHPRPFDFFTPELKSALQGEIEIVPYRAFEEVFAKGLRKGDGQSIKALRAATTARVVHIIPPPPKADNAHIERHHESLFAKDGLANHGVSPPELRLKFWNLQTQVLGALCGEIDVELMMPPERTVDESGFLRPEFYARDATHGNWRYGERVLREIEKRFLAEPANKS